MLYLIVMLCLASTSVPLVTIQETTQAEKKPAPIDLLEGGWERWKGAKESWRFEDGVLIGESTAEAPLKASTYITWQGQNPEDEKSGLVGDFELELEFRIHGGNSGIQFRSKFTKFTRVSGYQADMEAGPNWTGGLYEQDGRGIVCRRGQSVVLLPENKKTVEALPNAEELEKVVRKEDWNQYRIRAVGKRIELFINGKLTAVIVDEDAKRFRAEGCLALQLHQGPPMKVEYRKLRLLRL